MTRTIVASSLVAVLVAGCDGLWLDTYWRSERYVLLVVDARGQMSLSFDLGNGTAVGLVGPTVFSVGADDKHIVVKQHPSKDSFGSSFDRSTTHYFVVARTTSREIAERQKGGSWTTHRNGVRGADDSAVATTVQQDVCGP